MTITTGDGIALEAAVSRPATPRGSLAFCHPHPQMGGTMNAPLLLAITDRLVSDGWLVVRFNFRGIGRSGGTSSTGLDEVADAAAALDLCAAEAAGLPIALAGWSFGAAVAIRTMSGRRDLVAGVAIAPAVKEKPGITAGTPPPDDVRIAAPLLVVCGANDDQVDPVDCAAWASGVPSARYVEMRGANHFFWGKYDALADTVSSFLDEVTRDERGGRG